MHAIPQEKPHRWRIVAYLLQRRSDLLVLHLAFALFVACTVAQSVWHGPWRDEAQAWLMARDLSIPQLFLEARHDGHPILWHLCLKLVQAAGLNYEGMELLNAAFICGAVGLLFYRSRLPLLARLAFAFCPACLLDVSYHSRNYAISAFFLFLAATAFRQAERRPLLFATLLGLVAQTNLYGAAVFLGAAFQFLLEQGYRGEGSGFSVRPLYTRYLAPNLILAAAALLLVAELVPLPGIFPPPQPETLTAAAAPTGGSTTPLPAWEKLLQHFGNVVLLRFQPHLIVYLAIATTLLLFRKSPGARRIYGVGVMLLAALILVITYPYSSRHFFVLTSGAFYFAWIFFDNLYLRNAGQPTRSSSSLPGTAGWVALSLVALCLATQTESLHFASSNLWDGRNTAQAIREHQLDRADTIVVTTDPSRAVSVLMPLSQIHDDYRPAPWPGGPGSFADSFYYRQRKHTPTVREIEPIVLDVAAAHPAKSIVVLSADPHDDSVTASPNPACPLRLVYRSPEQPAADDTEGFEVYVLDRPGPGAKSP